MYKKYLLTKYRKYAIFLTLNQIINRYYEEKRNDFCKS